MSLAARLFLMQNFKWTSIEEKGQLNFCVML